MKQCLLCNQFFAVKPDLFDLFIFKKITGPRICPHCKKRFPLLKKTQCKICDKEMTKNEICSDCQMWDEIYHGKILKNRAIYEYSSAFHDLMVQYKRYGDYELRKVLQELIKDQLQKFEYDFYVPIPTSPEHRDRRQFDTISAIFQPLFPLTFMLEKKSGTRAQGQKNREQRLKTPQSFLIANLDGIRDNISNQRILLLDDIYATGRTLYNARDKLLEVFPEVQIESFSICR